MRGLGHMLSMLACFELLTQPDGAHRRRCCVRRIIWTRALAFGRRRCRPLQQGCCGSNTAVRIDADQRWNAAGRKGPFSADLQKTNRSPKSRSPSVMTLTDSKRRENLAFFLTVSNGSYFQNTWLFLKKSRLRALITFETKKNDGYRNQLITRFSRLCTRLII